jgi:hypothetical protein
MSGCWGGRGKGKEKSIFGLTRQQPTDFSAANALIVVRGMFETV